MTLLRRIANLFSRSRIDREIEAELQAHIEMRIEDNLGAGMDAPAAARNARLRFGNLAATREQVTSIDAALGLQSVWRDVIYGFRGLRKNAGFSAVAIITLALGIGANAGIYTVLNAVLLKSLPVNQPGQLRLLKIGGEEAEHARFSYLILDRMRAALPPSASLGMSSWPSGFNVKLGEGEAERQTGQLVSGEFFSVLRTHPALGRLLTPEDDLPASGAVAVLSYDFWSKRLGQSASVLNQKMLINGIPVMVVGGCCSGFFRGAGGGRSRFLAAAPSAAAGALRSALQQPACEPRPTLGASAGHALAAGGSASYQGGRHTPDRGPTQCDLSR